jgi:uncharacterized protein (TIGR04255 family)
MPNTSAKFTHPPVIETVLSVQFAPIPDFTAAHAGRFFEGWLTKELPEWRNAKLSEGSKIPDIAEPFGGPEFTRPVLQLMPVGNEPDRIMIAREDRMIQLQDNRIAYNWRKATAGYPSYGKLRPEFDRILSVFSRFLEDVGLKRIAPNHWEVIYVNHVHLGNLWGGVSEWGKVFPSLYIPPVPPSVTTFETLAGNWRYRLKKDQGRLIVSLNHGKTSEHKEVIILHLTARGPIDESRGFTAHEGLQLGHDAIVGAFYMMTSKLAHNEWNGAANVNS